MRILHIVQKPQRRGAEIFAYQLSQAQVKQGHQVKTLYLYPNQSTDSLPLTAEAIVLPGNEFHFFEKFPTFDPRLLYQLIAEIDKFEPHVVQANGGRTLKYGALAAILRPQKHWRLIYKNIDNPSYWVRDPLRQAFYRLIMRQIDGVIGVSEATLQSVQDLYHLDVPHTTILNGRDPRSLQWNETQAEIRKRLGTEPHVAVLLFIGRLTRQKRPDRFLRVVQSVHNQHQQIEAWIVGDGPLNPELRHQSRTSGLESFTRFWGNQPEVAPFLVASDLLLSTSDSEGTPGVILEAGFVGKPVVATRVGGTEGCIKNGQTGILVDVHDEEGLTQSVLSLLQDPVKRLHLGVSAKNWAEQTFTIDRAAEEYCEFYKNVLSI